LLPFLFFSSWLQTPLYSPSFTFVFFFSVFYPSFTPFFYELQPLPNRSGSEIVPCCLLFSPPSIVLMIRRLSLFPPFKCIFPRPNVFFFFSVDSLIFLQCSPSPPPSFSLRSCVRMCTKIVFGFTFFALSADYHHFPSLSLDTSEIFFFSFHVSNSLWVCCPFPLSFSTRTTTLDPLSLSSFDPLSRFFSVCLDY